ncbi:hypothetical protein QSV08_14430 [Maribacter sp. BPC-D8]|uniref:hypothetical protein n=1 Tax=Maribacter sp. BPC-D8 TaxID=3053613 RepID=UPI002B46817F|nr:hypothetical protein [Maribacter sp. BPC-D8]WRI28411.1 hypothetical protein QSV08_14430 [Maribacter sp. BPC-D8]
MLLNFKSLVVICAMMINFNVVAQIAKAIYKKESVVTVNNNTVTNASAAPINPIQNDVWYYTSDSENSIPKIWNGIIWASMVYTGTQESIFYTTTNKYPSQDNGNLFSDCTNSRLGLKTNSAHARLDVARRTVRLSDYGTGTISGIATNILAVEADGDIVEVDLSTFITNNQSLSTASSAGNVCISSGNEITLNVEDDDDSLNETQTITKTGNTITLNKSGGSVTEIKKAIYQNIGAAIISNSSENGTKTFSVAIVQRLVTTNYVDRTSYFTILNF